MPAERSSLDCNNVCHCSLDLGKRLDESLIFYYFEKQGRGRNLFLVHWSFGEHHLSHIIAAACRSGSTPRQLGDGLGLGQEGFKERGREESRKYRSIRFP